MSEFTAVPPSPAADASLISPRLFGRGMAVIRIFFGVVLLANGLAKIDADLSRINVGWYHGNLVNRVDARRILNFEVNERQVTRDAPKGTKVPGLRRLVNDVFLKHWDGLFGWFITIFEVVIGALLIVGLATRLTALVDLGQQLFLAAVYFSSNRWMFEQPHEYLPLIVLALVPAGRIWGVDAWIVSNYPRLRRWPF